MIGRVVVYYWHEGSWFWSRDYPTSQQDEALEYGRELWRRGSAGVKISRYEEIIVAEHKRSDVLPNRATSQGPRTTGEDGR